MKGDTRGSPKAGMPFLDLPPPLLAPPGSAWQLPVTSVLQAAAGTLPAQPQALGSPLNRPPLFITLPKLRTVPGLDSILPHLLLQPTL